MITSTANDRIKQIRKLRDRKYREASSQYFIEGTRIVFEAIKSNQPMDTMLYSSEISRNQTDIELIEKAQKRGIEILEVSKDVYLSISQKEGAQGISAVLRQNWTQLNSIQKTGVWIALHEVADPGNLGTIVRTADATGVKGIILIDNCTDPYDPVSMRASMGGIYSLVLIKTTTSIFTEQLFGRIPIIGTSDAAKADFHSVEYPQNMILLMGSERQGLSRQLEETCSHMVSIPMLGNCDSLNLAVSTGIVLYEILNQHQKTMVMK